MSDFDRLPKLLQPETTEKLPSFSKHEFIDFEECKRQGIDAIEYAYTLAHQDELQGELMDEKMFGWDCDCILIMNPKVILRESFLEEKTLCYLEKA